MENNIYIKCSSKNHKDLEAINYCQECKINMCSKCSNSHSQIFENHNLEKLTTENNETFDGFCSEKNHNLELEFFCITHNQLCCAACLCKIKNKGKGQHNECNVCNIEEIKNIKKNEFNQNINILENFSQIIEKMINELKKINKEIIENKESLKKEVQNKFTLIRNLLKEREDKLLDEIEKKYNELYFKEEMIKKSDKLPTKTKLSLEKGKIINNEWDNDNKLNYIIFNCVKIENNIKEVNEINDYIKKYRTSNRKIKFSPEDFKEEELDAVKNWGKIEISDEPENNFLLQLGEVNLNEENIIEENINNNIINNEEEEENYQNNFKLINIIPEDDISKFIRIIKEQLEEYFNKNIQSKLIYNANRDGDNYKYCHEKCNNVPNTFSLIIIDNGAKFGFFKSIPINGDGPWRVDNKAFFFSYDKNKIYKIKKQKYVVGFDDNCFVQTIGFTLSGNILNGQYSYNQQQLNENFEGFTENYELTLGKNKFYVKKFEVYQLKF